MEITWLGHSCFKIQDKNITLITDPFDSQTGLKPLIKLKANIVTVSHDHLDHNNIKVVSGIEEEPPFIVSSPGEYEIKNVFIYGIPSFHDEDKGKQRGLNTIFLIKMSEITIAHLGDLGHILSDEQLEKIEKVDILLIPVGGTFTIDAKKAKQVINQIEPKIIIPMHYKVPEFKENLDEIDNFYQEMGIEKSQLINKLKISKKDLISQTEMRVVEMEN
ncbi:lactamase [Candidatus Kuenenbacteria bacterium HGW-Kuenenbacteria-1]|uniref:Lactamase n=1 Tax=Candidatus Kuenenbacteria bacterium HGW-Kuenenbacteria-1 TaxID=2013812 RepID=A0A2N1UP92_9BACT|nr:MAG: lactamase [Candidatus Kuenenbacteria bacterium HGW-Kuenenbacteria-1]